MRKVIAGVLCVMGVAIALVVDALLLNLLGVRGTGFDDTLVRGVSGIVALCFGLAAAEHVNDLLTARMSRRKSKKFRGQ